MAATLFSPLRVRRMSARNLQDDSDGVILPYVAIMLAVIIGLSALAFDASRLMSIQTQLQAGADALVLAGAAELDRRPDSIIRAEAAIRTLLANPILGAGIGQSAEASSIQFLRSLPANDDLPVTTRDLTDDPTLAAYVQVTVRPIAMRTIFPISLSVGNRDISVSAQSVAGYDQIVCNVAPLFVCNPFESSGMSYYQATQALVAADQNPAAHRQLIRIARSQSKNGGYRAGDFGYISPATGFLPNGCGPGAGRGIPQAFAATQLRACFRLSGINLVSGDDQSVMDGLNTRFDIYAGGFNACRIYPPDLNVRKGLPLSGIKIGAMLVPTGPVGRSQYPSGTPLPPDSNMIQGNHFNANIAIGAGIWDCASYWSVAHAVGPGRDPLPKGAQPRPQLAAMMCIVTN